MKRLWLILFILFSSLLFPEEKPFLREYTYKISDYGYEQTSALPKNYEQDTSLFGKITVPLGHVFIQSIVDDNWEKARFNRDVFSNEKVKTETKSRCEIKLGEKKVLRIGEKTIVTLMYPEVNNVAMQIESGQAWLTDFSKKRSTTSVRTPTAVAAIRGTVFRIDCDNNQSTINVYKGMVDVTPLKEEGITPEDTTFSINAGEKFVVVKNIEKYREQQEKALKVFQDKEESDFQAFLNRENQEFKKAVQSEKQAFERFRSVHINKSKIDDKKDQSSDWVNWNKERDGVLLK